MNDGRWRISVTAPDWGQDHLSSDAVVAFVDEELAQGAYLRASQHLARCQECAAQVVAQGQARSALRTADCPSLPSSLLNSLRSIPQDADLPAPPPGLAMTVDGRFVSVVRPERAAPHDPDRADLGAAPAPAQRRRPQAHRRIRLGAGVAVSGLALGALALGVPTALSGPAAPATAPDRGLLGVPAFGNGSATLDAQLRLAPVTTPASRPQVLPERIDRIPGAFHGLP
jgi:anti-sigma factor RsiW